MPFGKSLRMFLASLMLIGNPSLWLGLALATPLRWGLPAFLASLLLTARVKAASLTAGGSKMVDTRNIHLGEDPKDEDFHGLHFFEVPLVPKEGPVQSGENKDLSMAVKETAQDTLDETDGHLQSFVETHPQSRWIPAVELNRGLDLYRRGYFSKALDAFQAAWEAGKNGKAQEIKGVADLALGEFIRMNSRVGRVEEVETGLAEMKVRGPEGRAGRDYEDARDSLWMMKNQPGKSFRCGPFALQKILAFEKSKKAMDPALLNFDSTPKGLPLDEVWKLSGKLGMDYQIAQRTPGAKVLLPALVHWKLGHYAALLEEKNGLYHSEDPTFGNGTWLSQKALDAESTGYCLVPAGPLPEGWKKVDPAEAAKIWGSGQVNGHQDQVNPCDTVLCKPCAGCGGDPSAGTAGDDSGGDFGPAPSDPPDTDTVDQPTPSQAPGDPGPKVDPDLLWLFGDQAKDIGMPRANIDLGLVALVLADTPMGYKPPLGPSVFLQLTYNQQSSSGGPGGSPQFGPNWSFNWIGYVQYDINSSGGGSPVISNYTLTPRGGGSEAFTPGQTTPFSDSLIQVSQTQLGYPTGFIRQLKNGWTENYGTAFVGSTSADVMLTQVTDPQGHSLTFQYDSNIRLLSVTDALGRKTTFSYTGNDLKITRATDPFGRSASFQYDTQGRLQSITDMYHLTTSFTYNANPQYPTDWITQMTTPYGNTSIDYTGTDLVGARDIEITDPLGLKQHARFTQPNLPSDSLEGLLPPVPNGIDDTNFYLEFRNTFYWDEKAMSDAPLQTSSATVYHWLHTPDGTRQSFFLESMKKPLENRIWYHYTGQSQIQAGDTTTNNPIAIARILGDGSTQFSSYTYNGFGKMTSSTDAKGRGVSYIYDTNNLDLISQQDGNGDVLQSYSYNGQHEPLTKTDASGGTWHYVYNGQGLLQSVTTPMGEAVQYAYDSHGNLKSLTPPQPGAGVTFTYDALDRVQSRTDAVQGTLNYQYDPTDRVTKILYPDGTSQLFAYDKLDLQAVTDRQGRTTYYSRDADERLSSVTDPKSQTTQFGWCSCGAMASLTDPKGNQTSWTRDLQGRVTQKTFPDSSSVKYNYDSTTSRLLSVQDGNNNETEYSYDVDDKILGVSYLTEGTITPSVSYQYDPLLGRLTSMTDGTGTSTYSYYPLVPGTPGAGSLQSVSQPVGTTHASLTYTYDADGRMTGRSIDSAAENYGFAVNTGQLTQVVNPLGNFGYTYDPNSARLTQVTYPNGQQTNLDYYPVSGSGRLKDITNIGAGSTSGQTLSKFCYAYAAQGDITSWTKQMGNDPSAAVTNAFGYDADSQLSAVTQTANSVPSRATTFTYDASGNRTEEQLTVGTTQAGSFSNTFDTNNLNQLTDVHSSPVSVQGSTNKPASITVNGQGVTEDANNNYLTTVPAASGSSTPITVTQVGQDGQANVIEDSVLSKAPFSYDANGNLLKDDLKTYSWDAANRLIQVQWINAQPATVADNINFTYDGLGRRASITEKHGSAVLTAKTFVWCGVQLCQERDVTGQTVNKQFFSQGEMIGPTKYFYTRDHLGSVREMTDVNGVVQARYDYDAYGRQTKLVETVPSDFGYTGFYQEAAAGLDLTWYRAYDPEKGRWISRDPLAEAAGINLYRYVNNQTMRSIDPFGLDDKSDFENIVDAISDAVQDFLGWVLGEDVPDSPVPAGAVKGTGAATRASCIMVHEQATEVAGMAPGDPNSALDTTDAYAQTVEARNALISNQPTPTEDPTPSP